MLFCHVVETAWHLQIFAVLIRERDVYAEPVHMRRPEGFDLRHVGRLATNRRSA